MFAPTNMPTQSSAHPSADQRAHARAVLARYVAELFAEPDDDWRNRLIDNATRREVDDAARMLELRLAPAAALSIPNTCDVLEDRNQLFGHTVRSACPPYELEYGRSEIFQQSQSLADIAGFYAAFGYRSGGHLAERPDHIVAEWEFLSVLARKESLAIASGNTDAAQCCHDAQHKFLKEHAAAWMPAFCARLRKNEPGAFFSGVVKLVEALLASWCSTFHVPSGPAWLELRPVDEDDSTITCGGEGDGHNVELGPTLAAALSARS